MGGPCVWGQQQCCAAHSPASGRAKNDEPQGSPPGGDDDDSASESSPAAPGSGQAQGDGPQGPPPECEDANYVGPFCHISEKPDYPYDSKNEVDEETSNCVDLNQTRYYHLHLNLMEEETN